MIPIIISLNPISKYINNWKRSLTIIMLILIIFLRKLTIDYKEVIETQKLEEKLEIKKKNIKRKDDTIESYVGVLESFPEDFLKLVYKELELDNNCRISLYVYDETEFYIIGRYSYNPEFKKKNRDKYPKDEGYISKCWVNENGKPYFYVDNLPDVKDPSYIDTVNSETNMAKGLLRSLIMKSRSYYVRMITKDGEFDESNGVVVIETTNETFSISEECITKKLNSPIIIPNLHRLIESNRTIGGGTNERKN